MFAISHKTRAACLFAALVVSVGSGAHSAHGQDCYRNYRDVYRNGNYTWSGCSVTYSSAVQMATGDCIIGMKVNYIGLFRNGQLVQTWPFNCSGQTRRPLSDYLNEIKNTYARVKGLRDSATSYTTGLTDSQFRQVNQLISSYNSLRQEAVSAYGSAPFASYPPLALMQWYYQIRYNGVVYQRGPFGAWDPMAGDYASLKRSYPTLTLLRVFAR